VSLFYMRHARPIAKAAGVGFDNQAFFIVGPVLRGSQFGHLLSGPINFKLRHYREET
jgi:hypothetical protein